MKTAKAYTLTELMMSLAITSIIGLSVAGVSLALTNAYGYSEQYYSYMQTGRVVMTRLQDDVRRSKLVAAISSTSLLVWVGDADNDGQISLSELALIEYNASTRQLKETTISYPASMSQQTRHGLDTALTLAQAMNLASASNLLRSNAYSRVDVIASDVRGAEFSCSPAIPYASLVKILLTVGQGADTVVTLRSAAYMRADATSRITVQGASYILN